MSRDLQTLMVIVVLILCGSTARAEVRIKDITTVEGARGNQLFGIGLVIGLNNTGSREPATQQMAIDMLRKNDVTTAIARQALTDNVFKSGSISIVGVTADLSGYSRKGSKLDVIVSVTDSASSLQGGILIRTPLKGADGEVYAVAQGSVSIGGAVTRGANNGQPVHPTVGRIQGGAYVEREELNQINQKGFVHLLLRDEDYSTSTKISQAINARFPGSANTKDEGLVKVRVPTAYANRVTEFVNEIGQLWVSPDTTAKVVINERTGTVIVGHRVRVSGVGIMHRNIVINSNMSALSRPTAGGTSPVPNPPLLVPPPPADDSDRFRALPAPPDPSDRASAALQNDQTYTVAELARVLNALGVTPQDLIAIFESLKDSGQLHAELVIK